MGKNRKPASKSGPRKPKITNKPTTRFRAPTTQEILDVLERRNEERARPKIPWANDPE